MSDGTTPATGTTVRLIPAQGGNGVAALPATSAKEPGTSAKAWRKSSTKGEWYTLPGSGNEALLLRPGLMGMVTQAGTVPNPISEKALIFLASVGDIRTFSEDDRVRAYKENAHAFIELARLCMLSPRIAVITDQHPQPDEDANEIAPTDMVDRDLLFIVYTFLMGEAKELATFRVN